ncbi:hypothetical protein PG997_012179 [Apiospora hydei]|uniref:Uncharacterized protein n=1 Tax=Apiospora hydei TaxID=1337664 RepID=A0ABR1V2M1_9PEZI
MPVWPGATIREPRRHTRLQASTSPNDDPRPAKHFFRNFLTANRYIYMAGGEKPIGDKRAKEVWEKARAEVNLTIVFEAIWYFSDFWVMRSFWTRISGFLKYSGSANLSTDLRAMVYAYCDARSTFLQKQQQGQEAGPAPGSRLVELVDHVNELREQLDPSISVFVTSEIWARRMEGWKQRLQEVMGELEVPNAPQLKDGQASSMSPAPSHAAENDPNEEHPISTGNGAGDKPDNASKESTPFFFDVSGKKGEVSGRKKRSSRRRQRRHPQFWEFT